MRWDELFADLEAQAEADDAAERAGEVDERRRIEVGRLRLIDRLRPSVDARVFVRCDGELTLNGVLTRVGSEWILLDEGQGRDALIALSAVQSVGGLGRLSAAPESEGVVASRLGLRHVLRGLTRDRLPARIHLRDRQVLDGTLDRVGADFVEIAVHAPGEWRRRGEVRDVAVVPLAALVAVRRAT